MTVGYVTDKKTISRIKVLFEAEKESWGIREGLRQALIDLRELQEDEKYVSWDKMAELKK